MWEPIRAKCEISAAALRGEGRRDGYLARLEGVGQLLAIADAVKPSGLDWNHDRLEQNGGVQDLCRPAVHLGLQVEFAAGVATLSPELEHAIAGIGRVIDFKLGSTRTGLSVPGRES